MSKLFTIFATLLLSLFVTSSAWAKVEYDSSQLMMQNSEKVTELVRKRIQRASEVQEQQDESATVMAEPEALEYLKDAMRIALARPDQDGLRGILFARIRRELSDLNSTEVVLSQLADESLAVLNDKKAVVAHHATYILVLENLMAEIKPELEKNKTFQQFLQNNHLGFRPKLKFRGQLLQDHMKVRV